MRQSAINGIYFQMNFVDLRVIVDLDKILRTPDGRIRVDVFDESLGVILHRIIKHGFEQDDVESRLGTVDVGLVQSKFDTKSTHQ